MFWTSPWCYVSLRNVIRLRYTKSKNIMTLFDITCYFSQTRSKATIYYIILRCTLAVTRGVVVPSVQLQLPFPGETLAIRPTEFGMPRGWAMMPWVNISFSQPMMLHTVDGSEIRLTSWANVVYPQYFNKVFFTCRWCRISSINNSSPGRVEVFNHNMSIDLEDAPGAENMDVDVLYM